MDKNFMVFLKTNDLLDWYYNFDKKERKEIEHNLKDFNYWVWEKLYMFTQVLTTPSYKRKKWK
jgi:hypothetical protein